MIIGIIGGGQLGMMLAEAAIELNHRIVGLDPNPKCSLSLIADEMIVANYNNHKAFRQLVDKVDVITYEFENVDLSLIEENINLIPQKSKGLMKSNNRLIEKEYANNLGIPTAKYMEFKAKDKSFYPAIIKTATGGYDGKGQYLIKSHKDVDQLLLISGVSYIIEELVSFEYEISVVATRGMSGDIVTYPISRNEHRNGILFISKAYNDIPTEIKLKAIQYTEILINDLDYVGTLAVEFFVRGNEVIFNEFAPRPHNSGHYTIEGCNVSQFKNHILAITGQKLIVPQLIKPTIMINILGQDYRYLERLSDKEDILHMYGKLEQKIGRKMGHLTVTRDTIIDVENAKKYIIEE